MKKIFNFKIEPEAIEQLKAIAKQQDSDPSKLARLAIHNLIQMHSELNKRKNPAA